MNKLIVNVDGASRGNPGHASAGAIASIPGGRIVDTVSAYLGKATNNVAEYYSLIIGLKLAKKLGAEEVEIRSDSELVVKQMTGVYKIKSAPLKKLAGEAAAIVRQFQEVRFVHIPRGENSAADKLANKALDDATGVIKGPHKKGTK